MQSRKILLLFIGCVFFKFILFDLDWSLHTTFSSFSFPQTYLTKILLASLLAIPFLYIRSRWYLVVLGTLLDILLIINLMYFRTYYTAIPWSSYFLAGNLSEFVSSVFASLRWLDLGFPLLTALFLLLARKLDFYSLRKESKKAMALLGVFIGAPVVSLGIIFACYGGYKKAYEDLLIDFQTCGTPIYTVFGSLYYEHLQERVEYTPQIKEEIETWLSEQPERKPLPFKIEARDNCIIILAESFENWVLEKAVEGNEITPNLNRYLKESQTLYAPYVQTQVKGSRSIDGQLLLHTGLLPIKFGAYSARFPHHTYYSIDKAFKEKYADGCTRCLTVDKKVVWNVAIVAQDFGYDKLLDKPYFELDEKTGPRQRLGDVSFLRQCAEKLESDEGLFATGGHTLVQCVTYSGHFPLMIPEESKRISFSERIPKLLKEYMVVANYTDYAIGQFIDRLRSQPKFANTMFVITGDHEGFGTHRKGLYADPVGKDIISPNCFTPFIVINSPISLRYEKVMGQVDMYTTLLDLFGAEDYPWRGMGQSILSPDKKGYALSSQMEIIGDTVGVCPDEIAHAKKAWEISDLIICCDYFKYAENEYGKKERK